MNLQVCFWEMIQVNLDSKLVSSSSQTALRGMCCFLLLKVRQ